MKQADIKEGAIYECSNGQIRMVVSANRRTIEYRTIGESRKLYRTGGMTLCRTSPEVFSGWIERELHLTEALH